MLSTVSMSFLKSTSGVGIAAEVGIIAGTDLVQEVSFDSQY